MLGGGDRRSIGRAAEALAALDADPSLLDCLVSAMGSTDPLICMRAADVVQKFAAAHPEAIGVYKSGFLRLALVARQQELRWHLAQILPGMELDPAEVGMVFDVFYGYLGDRSAIVRTFAMQGLADLAEKDPSLVPRVLPILEECTQNGTRAMKSRGRKLLSKFTRAVKSRSSRLSQGKTG